MTAHLDLHGALRRYSYDHAVFCTYNFHADFFEKYCLEQFESLGTNNGITVIMDGREMDRLLAGPAPSQPRWANVRYLLHPVRPRGRFHPKAFLLASKTRGLLVVGSANLTRAGLTCNAELARSFSFEVGKRELALPLFQAARMFFGEVAARWPSGELTNRLDDLDADAAWLGGTPVTPLPVTLLHNMTTPLLPQMTRNLEAPVREVAVVSPYFDEDPRLLDWLEQNANPKAVAIYTRNGAPGLTSAWLAHSTMKTGTCRLLFSHWGEEGRSRQLHGKAIAISHGKATRLAFGSANFTRAALLATPDDGNVEVVLLLDDVPGKGLHAAKLFDPSGRATQEPLVPCERQAEEVAPRYPLRLVEASLEDGSLRCLVGDDGETALSLVMRFHDGGSRAQELSGYGSDRRAELDEVVSMRADGGTTVAFLLDRAGRESNRVLLINLKDIATGGSLRKERRVKDAQRSADQFAAALLELLRLKDTDPLQSFLTYCDIPLLGAARLRGIARPPLSLAQVRNELRLLGEHNLREYGSLHDAVIGFSARHVARLKRHARRASIEGVPGCMHLVRSVAGVLATQIQRLLEGLSHVDQVSVSDWYDYRTKLDQLLKQWSGLLRVVHAEWLEALQSAYDVDEIKAAIVPDLEPLKDLARGFPEVRDHMLAVMEGFRVPTPALVRLPPIITSDNVIHATRWKRWVDEVRTHQRALEAVGE